MSTSVRLTGKRVSYIKCVFNFSLQLFSKTVLAPINLLKPTGYVMHQQFNLLKSTGYVMHQQFNLLKPTGYVMHQQFNIVRSAHTVFMCFVFI